MEMRDIAKDFVISHFNVPEEFFDTAWNFINENFEKISSLASSSAGINALEGTMAFGGSEERGAVKAILIFADGFREMPLKSDLSDFVDSIRGACSKYHAEVRLTEEILKKVSSLENRIAKFMKPELPIRAVVSGKEEKAEYRVWYKDSEPKGKPLDSKEKEDIVTNPKKYELLIIREETRTQVFIRGEESKRPPGKLAYRILVYVLKHKGAGGTAWNIAQHVWESTCTASFKDVRESMKAIEMQQRIEKAKIEDSMTEIERISALVRRRVTDLNKRFFKKLKVKLEADKEMDEYEFIPRVPNYCLIEKI